LERNSVGFVEFEATKVIEGELHGGVIGGDAGIEERESAERGDAAVVAGELGPVAAGLLFAFEEADAVVDRG
jgi:hypothetical protein